MSNFDKARRSLFCRFYFVRGLDPASYSCQIH